MILDTDALSAFADGDSEIEHPLQSASAIWIPSIVLGEFRFGIIQSRKKAEYEAWLDSLATQENTLCPDDTTATLYAHIRLSLKKRGRPIPYHDIWIAALGLQHQQPILSRDKHFDEIQKLKRITW